MCTLPERLRRNSTLIAELFLDWDWSAEELERLGCGDSLSELLALARLQLEMAIKKESKVGQN